MLRGRERLETLLHDLTHPALNGEPHSTIGTELHVGLDMCSLRCTDGSIEVKVSEPLNLLTNHLSDPPAEPVCSVRRNSDQLRSNSS
jgi:hypothetical protein